MEIEQVPALLAAAVFAAGITAYAADIERDATPRPLNNHKALDDSANAAD